MSWVMGFYAEAVCDRCGHELEDQDTGSSILFKASEPAHLDRWGWHEVHREGSTTELICPDCVDAIGTEDAELAKAVLATPPWPQTGPDLLGGETDA